MPISNPIHRTIAGLCIFTGMASAQAALTIHFEEDAANGQFSIFFSGEQAAPSLTMNNLGVGFDQFTTGVALVINSAGYLANMSSWVRNGDLPWTSDYRASISRSGNGGIFSTTSHEIYSAASNGNIVWDGTSTYRGSLEAIGLADGNFGSFSLTNGIDTVTINWSATVIPVPEPATYAAVLGLGIAGVALYRRRMSRR